MKNLILTTGILLLMITGMIYDQDCRNLIETQRRLKWVCEEAAYGAAVKLWREGKSLQEAEAAAEEVLRRNLDTVQWKMEMKDGVVEIQVDLGETDLRLPFLQGLVRAERRESFDFMKNFLGKGLKHLEKQSKSI